ncbi:MAG: hypothetical protein K1563_20465, partial [Candidatus Thiodiazotropha sp. (ex. Lucinisca nassula)]|nr:hypothetical protein [Candidatus Thiodiazotropha sp. (ex. Lucinisca nassula)]
ILGFSPGAALNVSEIAPRQLSWPTDQCRTWLSRRCRRTLWLSRPESCMGYVRGWASWNGTIVSGR